MSRRTAFTAGVLFLVTFAAAVAALLLYDPVLHRPDYVLGPGEDGRIALGALLELVLAAANIGTALVLLPLLRRQSEALAFGYVAARVLESTVIVVGIVSVLSVVSLRRLGQDATDAGALLVAARALVAVHDWTFLLGPNFVAGLGNGLILGWLLRRSGAVPPRLTLLGLIGGPLVCLSGIGVLFGLHTQTSPTAGVLALPEMLWEAGLGVVLVVQGVRSSSTVRSRASSSTA